MHNDVRPPKYGIINIVLTCFDPKFFGTSAEARKRPGDEGFAVEYQGKGQRIGTGHTHRIHVWYIYIY